ncbi:MAG: hypothetical protein Q9173_000454 [Seirophora scorigena]
MVISLEAFQTVSVNNEGVAQVGGGVRLGNLATGIYNQSKRALPHGICPGVGIGGHATHGGYCKWHILIRPIGIITTFHFQTLLAPTSMVNWNYIVPVSSGEEAAAAFSHIQDFALNASVIDDKIGFGVVPSPASFRIHGKYRGDEAVFKTKIAPELLRSLPAPSETSIKSLEWLVSLADEWGSPLPQPLSGYDEHDNFYAKSVVVPEATPLTPSALLNFFTYIVNSASTYPPVWFAELNLYGGPSSRINSPSPLAANSAYSHRDTLWVAQLYSTVPTAADGGEKAAIEFVQGLNDALGMGYDGYQNYVDPGLSAEEAHEAYYGSEVYARLLRVKEAVDPEHVFWNPQAVGEA